jgi:hypothetical protein
MYAWRNILHQARSCRDRAAGEARLLRAKAGVGPGPRVLGRRAGNRRIAERLRSGAPAMISRLGFSERRCVTWFLRERGAGRDYPAQLLREVRNSAGIFPAEAGVLDRFSRVFLERAREADVMGTWLAENESEFLREHCADAVVCDWRALEPYYSAEPWSAALAGRRVLVVHPFDRTIRRQYAERRTALFRDPAVLPEFELVTLRPVLSGFGCTPDFPDWFAALDHMEAAIARERFDVALIGAGSYGLPLAAFVKRLGRQAVHVGGAAQLLFGIRGRRWDHYPPMARRYNGHWVRPSPEETPAGAATVEGGCYW